MRSGEAIGNILESDIPTAFERFGNTLDAKWIDEALEETGTATVRRRKLPAEIVVWLVIGMALFRDRCIQEVVRHLGLVGHSRFAGTPRRPSFPQEPLTT